MGDHQANHPRWQLLFFVYVLGPVCGMVGASYLKGPLATWSLISAWLEPIWDGFIYFPKGVQISDASVDCAWKFFKESTQWGFRKKQDCSLAFYCEWSVESLIARLLLNHFGTNNPTNLHWGCRLPGLLRGEDLPTDLECNLCWIFLASCWNTPRGDNSNPDSDSAVSQLTQLTESVALTSNFLTLTYKL